MGEQVFYNPYVLIDSFDYSDYVKAVTLNISNDTPEITASGDGTRVRIIGLKDHSMEITLNQNWTVDTVDKELWDIYSGGAAVTFEFRPDQGAVSTSNPEYGGDVVLEGYTVGGSIGDVAEVAPSFQSASALTRATA